MDTNKLWFVAQERIDWSRWMKDLVDGILRKMGSFADDWYFRFCLEEGEILASSPHFMVDIDNNEIKRLQKVVFRKLKLCASQRSLISTLDWRNFQKKRQNVRKIGVQRQGDYRRGRRNSKTCRKLPFHLLWEIVLSEVPDRHLLGNQLFPTRWLDCSAQERSICFSW